MLCVSTAVSNLFLTYKSPRDGLAPSSVLDQSSLRGDQSGFGPSFCLLLFPRVTFLCFVSVSVCVLFFIWFSFTLLLHFDSAAGLLLVYDPAFCLVLLLVLLFCFCYGLLFPDFVYFCL